jgi:putative oxidoreductase
MNRLLGRLETPFFTLLRIAAGLLFACHGAQKLFGVLGGQRVVYTSQMGLAGFIEFVGGLLIAVGLFTRYAAIVACVEMAVAYSTLPHSEHG